LHFVGWLGEGEIKRLIILPGASVSTLLDYLGFPRYISKFASDAWFLPY